MNCWVKNGQKVVEPSKNASNKKNKKLFLEVCGPVEIKAHDDILLTFNLIILFINLTRNSSKS